MMSLTNYGVTSGSAQDTLKDIAGMFSNVFGISPDTTTGNSTNLFIQELTTIAITKQNQFSWLSGTIYNPNNAQGIFLEALCSFSNLYKSSGTYSTVTCEVTGLSGTVIPAGSVVINPTTNDQFVSVSSILIAISGTGSGLFQAIKKGVIPVEANSITQIQQNLPGWSTVNNSTSGIMGLLSQNDTQLRNIRKYALSLNSTGWYDAMNSALTNFMNQDGASTVVGGYKYVLGYYIFENNTNLPIPLPKDTATVLPHSIYITIYAPHFIPNSPTNQQYVAGILLRTKSAGCQTQNIQSNVSQQYNVNYINTKWTNAQPVNIKWDSPIPVPLLINISLIVTNPVTDILVFINNIKKAIVSQFYNGYDNHPPVKMVQDINTADYYPVIYDTVGNVSITNFTIKQVTGGQAPSNIFTALSPLFIPTLDEANVIVVVTRI